MSQLHKIVGNNDVLQPSKEQEETALEKSRAYWYHIASVAYAYLDHGLVPEFANPQHALHKIPRFPCRLKAQFVRPLGTTAIFALCSEASSTWRLIGNSDCEAVKKERTKPALVQIGTASTIPYSFCGKVFSHWIGMTAENATGPNYLGILAIGWCYILSAQLIEMQGSSAIMRYTDSLADCVGGRPSTLLGAIRRPSVAALWIGAAVSGIGHKLLEKVRRGRPPLDSIAFPWTGAPQSFIDDAGSGPYTWGDPAYISRPDVWRLLHLSPTEEDELSYEYGPMTPWEPCGACLTTNCALRVTSHLKCPRHEYRYEHWSWELEGGETVQNYGFLKTYPSR